MNEFEFDDELDDLIFGGDMDESLESDFDFDLDESYFDNDDDEDMSWKKTAIYVDDEPVYEEETIDFPDDDDWGL